jgi:CBS domain containing-hemolysin-like protein
VVTATRSDCLLCAKIRISPWHGALGQRYDQRAPHAAVRFCPRGPRGVLRFSTIVITLFGEIIPQAYFSRNALRMAARLKPLLSVDHVGLFPLAKPTAIILNWWLRVGGQGPDHVRGNPRSLVI